MTRCNAGPRKRPTQSVRPSNCRFVCCGAQLVEPILAYHVTNDADLLRPRFALLQPDADLNKKWPSTQPKKITASWFPLGLLSDVHTLPEEAVAAVSLFVE